MATRWGIVGTGRMGHALASTITDMGSEVTAVASTDQNRGAAFALEHGIGGVYPSAAELASSGDVDAVYVATTNDRHHGDVIACLQGGKPVLCEKPIALSMRDAAEMVGMSRELGVFLMEAMWMRFQPGIALALDLISQGRIGPISMLQAGFGIKANDDLARRWFSADLGGGSLYDLGVYPLALAHLLLGRPDQVVSIPLRAASGVDAQTGVLLGYDSGALAVLSSSLVADAGVEAVISGAEGRLVLHTPFHHPDRLSLCKRDRLVTEYQVDPVGYRTEVEEVERCLAAGLGESPVWSLDDSLAVVALMQEALEEDSATAKGSTNYD